MKTIKLVEQVDLTVPRFDNWRKGLCVRYRTYEVALRWWDIFGLFATRKLICEECRWINIEERDK